MGSNSIDLWKVTVFISIESAPPFEPIVFIINECLLLRTYFGTLHQ